MSGAAVCPTCGAPVGAGARFCASCGTPLGPAPAEERKLVTILFADVIGSTDLGEQLDPERLRALLADYFAAMARVVSDWDGTIEKYIGDAIMAVWGVPTAREDDALRALHAAAEMIAELERINPDLEARHGTALGIRIGVNTGEVIAPVDSRAGGQFLVSGDSVNVAARLEQAADPGTVLVGERTWLAARGAFEFRDAAELTVKGKRDPIVAHRLIAARALSDGRDESVRPFHAPMLGRDRELATLIGQLEESIERAEPRLVIVSGPAGIGKSRMLREFIEAARERVPDLMVLRGRCVPSGHGITYWALGEILRQVAAISLDEAAESAAAKLERATAGPLAAVGLAHDEIRQSVAALAMSANLPVTHNPLEGLDPEDLGDQIGRAWPRLLSGLARARPLAVLIEDIHWADARMVGMIESLAARSEGRLLLVATARPEFVEANTGFGGGTDASVVALRPLTDVQSERLIGELLGTSNLPSTLIDEIRRKADGNPFFVEELIQRLIDERAVIEVDGRWQATERAAEVKLPDTIHALLAARIDGLPADEKRLVQEAAVVGRIFWPGALALSADAGGSGSGSGGSVTAGGPMGPLLARLERRGLIAARQTSTIDNEPEYIFRHVLIRDVAYSSVPKKRRARAHDETARWIERLAGDRIDEFAELVAYHYTVAVTGDDADLAWADDPTGRELARRRGFETLLRAGGSARRRYAVGKALELHQHALDLAADDDERLRAHEALGDDHEALFHGDDAISEYLAAIDLLEAPAGSAHRIAEASASAEADEMSARLAVKAGRMVLRWGTFQGTPPIKQVQRIVAGALARPVSERLRAGLLMVHGGLLQGPNGAPLAAGRVPFVPELRPLILERIAAIEQGMEIARGLDDAELQYFGADLLAIANQSTGNYDAVHRAAEEMALLVERLKSAREQADALVFVSSTRADLGEYERALETAEDGLRRASGLSPHEQMHLAWEVLSAAEPIGRWDRIVELLPWYADASASEGSITCSAVRAGPVFGALILARRGEIDRARELVPLREAAPTNETFLTAALLADYATYAADASAARAAVRRALALEDAGFFEMGISPLIEALERLDMAEELDALLPLGRTMTDAVARIEPTITRAEAWLARRQRDDDRAAQLLRAALRRFEELAMPFEIARTQERLAQVAGDDERDALLRAALGRFQSVGAAPDAERVSNALDPTRYEATVGSGADDGSGSNAASAGK